MSSATVLTDPAAAQFQCQVCIRVRHDYNTETIHCITINFLSKLIQSVHEKTFGKLLRN